LAAELSACQLAGDWSFGARYRFSTADLQKEFTDIPSAAVVASGLPRNNGQLPTALAAASRPAGVGAVWFCPTVREVQPIIATKAAVAKIAKNRLADFMIMTSKS
jgi:hypothetical protein